MDVPVGLFGAAGGLMDVAMNAYASDVEAHMDWRVMASFHGMWSGGSVVGAAVAGYLLAISSDLTQAIVTLERIQNYLREIGLYAANYGPEDEHLEDILNHIVSLSVRVDQWVRANIHVPGRPEWVFIKVHTHGAIERTAGSLLGDGGHALHTAFAARILEETDAWRMVEGQVDPATIVVTPGIVESLMREREEVLGRPPTPDERPALVVEVPGPEQLQERILRRLLR